MRTPALTTKSESAASGASVWRRGPGAPFQPRFPARVMPEGMLIRVRPAKLIFESGVI